MKAPCFIANLITVEPSSERMPWCDFEYRIIRQLMAPNQTACIWGGGRRQGRRTRIISGCPAKWDA